jgi:hypothetical protein
MKSILFLKKIFYDFNLKLPLLSMNRNVKHTLKVTKALPRVIAFISTKSFAAKNKILIVVAISLLTIPDS